MQNHGLVRADASKAVLRSVPIPKLRDDYILVKTVAVALNPTDWTTLDAEGMNGPLIGCDYAGIVMEVGEAVKRPFKKGDRIAGFAHGENDACFENGAFARCISVKGDIQILIPDHVSFEEACTVGCGVMTAGYALFDVLKLPWPTTEVGPEGGHEKGTVFIYGGSTATGTLAIQFAKLSGYAVATTCSPKHFDLMKKLGADYIYDYHTLNVGREIRRATDDSLQLVLDTVTVKSSAAICADAFGSAGGVYCNLLDLQCPRDGVKSEFFLAYSCSGESYIFEGKDYPARPQDFEFAVNFMCLAEKWWAQKKWKNHPYRVEAGGLSGIGNGMQLMREGQVSGEKLVYRIEDTPAS